jgi:hypothetical protein
MALTVDSAQQEDTGYYDITIHGVINQIYDRQMTFTLSIYQSECE